MGFFKIFNKLLSTKSQAYVQKKRRNALDRCFFNMNLGNQSGQGVIEYLLVLVVIVLIVLGGVYQLNDAFRNWATNYFSDYLACIMETGELPAIGGSGVTVGECDQQFEPFTLAEGRPLIDSGGGSGPGNGGGSGTGDGSGGDGEDSSDGSGSDRTSTYNAGQSRGGGGRSFRVSSNSSGSGSGDEDGSGRNGRQKKIYTGSTDASIPAYALNSSESRFKVNRGIGGYGGVYDEDKDDKEHDEKTGGGSTKKSSLEKSEKRDRIKVTELPKKEEIPEDEPMTFGNFIRYLIIAAIIIALVVFLGGQALQMSKGME